jgi:cytidylate kinase
MKAGQRDIVVTIDGPAGAGKSTVAAEVARRLGFTLIDTGALYRGLAWAVQEAEVSLENGPALAAVLDRTSVRLDGPRVLVNGRDVSAEIRTPAISRLTSRLTTLGAVRDKMTPIQRSLAASGGAVLEGRDTGSVVWPEAEVKFYIDAVHKYKVDDQKLPRDTNAFVSEQAAKGIDDEQQTGLAERRPLDQELLPLRFLPIRADQ